MCGWGPCPEPCCTTHFHLLVLVPAVCRARHAILLRHSLFVRQRETRRDSSCKKVKDLLTRHTLRIAFPIVIVKLSSSKPKIPFLVPFHSIVLSSIPISLALPPPILSRDCRYCQLNLNASSYHHDNYYPSNTLRRSTYCYDQRHYDIGDLIRTLLQSPFRATRLCELSAHRFSAPPQLNLT